MRLNQTQTQTSTSMETKSRAPPRRGVKKRRSLRARFLPSAAAVVVKEGEGEEGEGEEKEEMRKKI